MLSACASPVGFQVTTSALGAHVALVPGRSVTLNDTVSGLAFEADGTPWLDARNLYKLLPSGQLVGMASGDNTGFGLDPRGGFWTSSSGGRLSSFGPKGEVRWQQDYMRGDYFPFPLAVDRDGNVWCAPKNIEKRAADGRLLASVDRTARSFLVEPGGNVLAIGYGVTRMAPDGTVMASFLAGYDPLIGKEDAAGTLWVATQPTTAHPWEVLAVSSDGSVKVSALQGQQTTSLAVDAAGNAWAVAREPGAIAHQVVGLTPDGKELATVKFTDQVWQVEVDPQGFLWVVTQHEQPPYESVLTQFRIER